MSKQQLTDIKTIVARQEEELHEADITIVGLRMDVERQAEVAEAHWQRTVQLLTRDRTKAEAINDQWEVKAADLMRERNEAEAALEAEARRYDTVFKQRNEAESALADEIQTNEVNWRVHREYQKDARAAKHESFINTLDCVRRQATTIGELQEALAEARTEANENYDSWVMATERGDQARADLADMTTERDEQSAGWSAEIDIGIAKYREVAAELAEAQAERDKFYRIAADARSGLSVRPDIAKADADLDARHAAHTKSLQSCGHDRDADCRCDDVANAKPPAHD